VFRFQTSRQPKKAGLVEKNSVSYDQLKISNNNDYSASGGPNNWRLILFVTLDIEYWNLFIIWCL
jgi:hypothetical protein